MSSIVIEFPANAVARRAADAGEAARPATARPTARPAGQVRLTRRGRAVVLGAALLAALLMGVLLGGGSMATGEAGSDIPTEIVVVNEGDTLWGLASAVADDGDVRAAMREIQRLNALDSKVLQLGQKVRVPLAGK